MQYNNQTNQKGEDVSTSVQGEKRLPLNQGGNTHRDTRKDHTCITKNRQVSRQTDRQTDRQAGKGTDRQADRQIDGHHTDT